MKTFFSLFLLICFAFSIHAAPNPLSVDEAFQFSATARDYQTILLRWKIAPMHYLYQKRFQITVLKPVHLQLGDPLYPAGAQLLKTPLGDFDVYSQSLILPIPIIDATQKSVVLQVHYQGCSQLGYCYPPTEKTVEINLAGNYMHWVRGLSMDVAPVKTSAETSAQTKSALITLLSFLGFGILLSLTPCVLPMVPILSSIIVGRKEISHRHAFLLSLFYVLGMACVYALIGFFFGVIGKNIQLVFQNPYVIVGFGLLFVVMALSMFGLFQLQLPEKWRQRILHTSQRQKRGSYVGVFVMGVLSTLILSPCVTPPLVAALGLISQSGRALMGSAALFMMGLGSGLPLLLIGLVGPKILPRPGRWMNVIKFLLGLLLLVVAFLMVARVFIAPAKPPLPFQQVYSVSQVEEIVKTHPKDTIMLDFYANWCISCQEMDRFTFSNPAVQNALEKMILLRVDLTANSPQNAAIMQQYAIIAPPTILFFKNGELLPVARMVGAQSAPRFLQELHANLLTSASN